MNTHVWETAVLPHGPEPSPPEVEAPDSSPDAGLVLRIKSGDADAFEELVREAGGRMLAVARRMLVNEDDAQDAVQEAFLSAIKSLDRFDGRSRLTTWLHRIVVNACLMKIRSRRRRPERSIEDLLPQFRDDGHQKTPSQSWKPAGPSGIEQGEVRELVRRMIGELPEQYRVVLTLRDIEGLDTEAAAEVLGVTPNAVKVRLHRARQALKSLLDPYFAEGFA